MSSACELRYLAVQMRQIGGKVVNALRVQEAADDITGLQVSHRLAVFRHRGAIIPAPIQCVASAPMHLGHHTRAGLCTQTKMCSTYESCL